MYSRRIRARTWISWWAEAARSSRAIVTEDLRRVVPGREKTFARQVSRRSSITKKLSRFPGPALTIGRSLMIRRNRRWFVHVLSLALSFAQLGMVVHASTHLKSNPHAAPTQSQLCGECISFASVQNAVGGTPTVVFVSSVSP